MVRRGGLWSACLSVVVIAGLLMLPSAGAAGAPRGGSPLASMNRQSDIGMLAGRVSRCAPGGCGEVSLARDARGLTALDAPRAATVRVVGIANFVFFPMTVTVALSTTVVWVNTASTTPHTTTSDTGVWDSGTLMPHKFFFFKFTRAGVYHYHCTIHPFMKGVVIVTSH